MKLRRFFCLVIFVTFPSFLKADESKSRNESTPVPTLEKIWKQLESAKGRYRIIPAFSGRSSPEETRRLFAPVVRGWISVPRRTHFLVFLKQQNRCASGCSATWPVLTHGDVRVYALYGHGDFAEFESVDKEAPVAPLSLFSRTEGPRYVVTSGSKFEHESYLSGSDKVEGGYFNPAFLSSHAPEGYDSLQVKKPYDVLKLMREPKKREVHYRRGHDKDTEQTISITLPVFVALVDESMDVGGWFFPHPNRVLHEQIAESLSRLQSFVELGLRFSADRDADPLVRAHGTFAAVASVMVASRMFETYTPKLGAEIAAHLARRNELEKILADTRSALQAADRLSANALQNELERALAGTGGNQPEKKDRGTLVTALTAAATALQAVVTYERKEIATHCEWLRRLQSPPGERKENEQVYVGYDHTPELLKKCAE